MINIFAVRKNFRAMYGNMRIFVLAAAMQACHRHDDRVKEIVAQMPEGTEICIGCFQFNWVMVCKKVNGELKCNVKKDYNPELSSAYIMFKSLEIGLPVLHGITSFATAFNQNRIILRGDTQMGMDVAKILDIAQAAASLHCIAKKHLTTKVSSAIEFKVKMEVVFRGWL